MQGWWARGLAAGTLALVLVGCAPAAPAPRAGDGAGVAAPARPAAQAASGPAAAGGALEPLIAAARQEGQIGLVWSATILGGSQGVARLIEGFNRTYGLNV